MANDYIPAPDLDAAAWANNFAALITAAPATYGLTAPNAVTIQTAADDYDAALTLALDPGTRTPATVAAKDNARETMETVCRPFAIQIRNNTAVTDLDKVAVGVTVPSTTRTPVPPPATAPELSLRSLAPGIANIGYADTGAPAGKAKPYGTIGVQVFVKVAAAPDADPANATFRQVATKSPFTIAFSGADAGQVASIFARFVTRGGPAGLQQNGPWSTMLSTFIA